MVKIVAKKEGAQMSCKNCGTDLVCRTKDYGGAYAPTLQWQNPDGKAHYKTTDGKDFSCNIPEEDSNQSKITEPATVPGISPPTLTSKNDVVIREGFEEMNLKLDRLDEMVQAIFRYTVDKQLGKV